LDTEIRGYAPGLALQDSEVSDFFRSVINCVLLLFSCLQLLDRLSNQLVDGFVRGVYTYEKRCHAIVKAMQSKDARHSGCNTKIKRKYISITIH
jgi:hypothetical protein